MDFINGETIGILLFFIGLYGLIARRNIVKTIVAVSIMQVACILFFLAIFFDKKMVPPIISNSNQATQYADPLPQALMITAIVIGVSITAVSLTMFITLYHKYGSTNWSKVKDKRISIDDD